MPLEVAYDPRQPEEPYIESLRLLVVDLPRMPLDVVVALVDRPSH